MFDEDARLVWQAQNGDVEAVARIYECYQPSIFTYIYYRVGDQALAEDLTSEVFTRLVDKLPTYTPSERPILAWLYTVAHNLLVGHYRKNNQQPEKNLPATLPDGSAGPEARTEAHLWREGLQMALHQLTEEQQQVIILKFVQDYSNAEIAAVLGKTEGAVKSMQHRALAALHRILERDYSYER